MNDVAAELRALELRVEAIAALPISGLPPAARPILGAVANLLTTVKWLIEDQEQARLRVIAGDGNDL